MWIFCGGMPRSGSTLQFQFTAHLVERAALGARVDWVRPAEFPRVREEYADQNGWKVFKTHICTPEIRAELETERARGVYVSRDVRDVVESRMRKEGQRFDPPWVLRFLDGILTNFERWTSLDSVLTSRYEDMVTDMAAEAERIARHLGISVSRDECARIASEYTVPRQRARIQEAGISGRLRQSAHGSIYDPVSNLHVDHLHSGESGGWKHVLASAEIALIEDRAKDWLVANRYALSLQGRDQ